MARGPSSRPWPASGSLHQSTPSLVSGCQNRIKNASPARIAGTGASESQALRPALPLVTSVTSPRALPHKHHREGLRHDLEILGGRAPPDVLEIIRHLPA